MAAGDPEVGERLAGYDPWRFLAPGDTRRHLEAAGFSAVDASLQEWPVRTDGGAEWLRTINLGGHVERLADDTLADRFVAAVHAELGGDPLTLRYVRLDIDATA